MNSLDPVWKRETSVFSYEFLWRAAQTALQMAEIEDPRIRKDHLSIHSLLAGFLAFEGFINYVGEEIAPEAWKDERGFFSKKPFRGIKGKVDYLFTRFPGKALDKGAEPYQTFQRTRATRDNLAHNRVLVCHEVSSREQPSFPTKWDDFDTPDKVASALSRLKEFAEIIRVEAVKLLKEDYQTSHLHFRAFEGPLGSSEGMSLPRPIT